MFVTICTNSISASVFSGLLLPMILTVSPPELTICTLCISKELQGSIGLLAFASVLSLKRVVKPELFFRIMILLLLVYSGDATAIVQLKLSLCTLTVNPNIYGAASV